MIKVLIADDEVKVIQLIEHLVDWQAFEMEIVGRVNDGEKALEAIFQQQPDLVVTDIRMPVINGLELVQKSQEAGQNPFFIMISGYSEFEYAQRAVQLGVEDYLLKPLRQKDLEAVLTKIRDKYHARMETDAARSSYDRNRQREKEQFLTDVLVHRRLDLFDLSEEEFALRYGFSLTGDYTECVILRIFTGAPGAASEDSDVYRFVLPKLHEIMKENISPKCTEYVSAVHHNDIIALISHTGEMKVPVMEELGKMKPRLLNYRNICPDLQAAAGISKPLTAIRQIPEAYRDASAALTRRFTAPETFIFFSDGYYPRPQPESPVFAAQDRKQLLSRIEVLDIPGFRKVAEDIFRRMKETPGQPGDISYTYHTLCESFLFGIRSFESPASRAEETEETLRAAINRICTLDELCVFYTDTCAECLERCQQEKKSIEDKPIRIAKQYIQKHFNEAISLESVSAEAGFNPAYFSTVFKKATGTNFMDYVKAVRIENAKDLLARTRMDVASVAQAVGYTDIKYFTRLFRQLTSLTPSDYRKLYG